jgi:hypothetical protein
LDKRCSTTPPVDISHRDFKAKTSYRWVIDLPDMALETPRIRLWQFRKAPSWLKALFGEGQDVDWVASVPEPLVDVFEPYYFRLRQLHPVSSVRLPDRSIVYWGAPRESITLLARQHAQPSVVAHSGRERRIGVRAPLACAVRYEAGSRAQKNMGEGRVIDMSSSGIAFTTECLLRRNTRVALHIQWPVRLQGDVPVELFASGKVVRTEPTRAALQYDQIAFRLL